MRLFMKIYPLIFTVLIIAPSGLAAERLSVFVSIVPQKYFVQQIGKDLVDVRAMVRPGASPATYEPKPRQMAELSTAAVYFAIGVPFEKAWLKKIAAANPKMPVIHTDHGIAKIPMAAHLHPENGDDSHGKVDPNEKGAPAQAQGIPDPHIWLSPPLVKMQARTMLTALQKIDPAHRAAYAANHRNFVARIDALDAQLKKIFAGKPERRFMVFHPAWGYFARAYGLRQVPIELEGKVPKPAQLKSLIEYARRKGIRIVFVQPQFSSQSAEVVAREIGGQVVFADPLAADWLVNLREVADKFEAALK